MKAQSVQAFAMTLMTSLVTADFIQKMWHRVYLRRNVPRRRLRFYYSLRVLVVRIHDCFSIMASNAIKWQQIIL